MQPCTRLLRGAAVTAGLAIGSLAHATDYIWDGASNSDWSNSANWQPSGVPGASDQAIFPAGVSGLTINIDGNQDVGKLFIAPENYQFVGNQLTVHTGDIELMADGGNTITFDCDLNLLTDIEFQTRDNHVVINGAVSHTHLTTTTKYGSGTLTDNGFGPTTGAYVEVREGAMIAGAYSVYNLYTFTLFPGATLSGDSLSILGLAGDGNLDIQTELSITQWPARTFSGDFSGNYTLTLGGSQTLTLDGDNSAFDGPLTISGNVKMLGDFGVNSTEIAYLNGKLWATATTPPLHVDRSGKLEAGANNGEVGTLTTAELTMTRNGTLVPTLFVDIGGHQAGVDHDLFVVNGPVVIDQAKIRVRYVDDFVASPGDAFTFLDGTSLAGHFTEFVYPDNQPWYVVYDEAAGTATLRFCDGGPDCDGDGLGDACELDEDGDGVPDDCDVCPGIPDDDPDADNDGVPDQCDTCLGNDFVGDRDGDGVCDDLDVCNGGDDNGPDSDGDGVPDACDTCEEAVFDADDDYDVDFDDFAGFDACLQGPGIATSVGCDCFDYNADLQLTMHDFADFQEAFRDQIVYEGPGEISIDNMKLGASDKGFAMLGEFQKSFAGFSVGLVGDLNGDGLAEVMVGAPSSGPNPEDQVGRAYIVWGKDDFATTELSDVASGIGGYAIDGAYGFFGHDWTVQEVGDSGAFPGYESYDGGPQGGGFGFHVGSAGDVNGDGVDDMLFTAPYAPVDDDIWGGESYVVFGGPRDANSPLAIDALVSFGGGQTLVGEKGACGFCNGIPAQEGNGDLAGWAGGGGNDFNGDGLADVLISAPNFGDADSGRGYIVHGRTAPGEVRLGELGDDGLTLDVNQTAGQGLWFDYTGDLDGDGRAEVWIANGSTTSWMVRGHDEGGYEPLHFSDRDPNKVIQVLYGPFTYDPNNGGEGRFSVLTPVGRGGGDFNGDGTSDYALAVDNWSLGVKEVMVLFDAPGTRPKLNDVFGPADTPNEPPLGGVRVFTAEYDIVGPQAKVELANDLNGDGYDDLVFYAAASQKLRTFVVFGGPDSRNIDLDNMELGVDGLMIWDRKAGKGAGNAFSTEADVNGDGLNDLAIGAPREDIPLGNAGAAYLVYSRDYTGAITHQGDETANTLNGTPDADAFVAGRGNDIVHANGGEDTVYAGAGDDLVVIADNTFRRIRGGAGTDTVRTTGGIDLDLVALRGRVGEIEQIDVTPNGADVVTLERIDVLNMSPTSNTVEIYAAADDQVVSLGADWEYTGDIGLAKRFVDGHAELLISQAAQLRMSPVINIGEVSVDENTPIGSPIASASATDPDGDGIVSFALIGGTGTSKFLLDEVNEAIVVNGDLDFETDESYTLIFEAIDGEGDVDTLVVAVAINPLNEAPTLMGDNLVTSIEEHVAAGTFIGNFSAADQDANDVTAFELDFSDPSLTSPAPEGSFAIDPNGVLTVADSAMLDYEDLGTVEFLVYAVDLAGLQSAPSLVTITLTDVTNWTLPIDRNFATVGASMWGTDTSAAPYGLAFDHTADMTHGPSETVGLLDVDFTVGVDGMIDVASSIDITPGSVDVTVPVAAQLTVPDEITLGQAFDLGLYFGGSAPDPTMSGMTPAANYELLITQTDFEVNTTIRNFGPFNATNSSNEHLTSSTPQPWTASVQTGNRIAIEGLDTRLVSADEVDWDAYLLQFLSLTGLPSNEGTFGPSTVNGVELTMDYVLWDFSMAGAMRVDQDLSLDINGYNTVMTLENGTQLTLTADALNSITLPTGADTNGDGFVEFTLAIDIDQTFTNESDFYGTLSKRIRAGIADVQARIPGCGSCQASHGFGPLIDVNPSVNIAHDDAGIPTPWPTGEAGVFPLGGFNTIVMTGAFDLTD